MKKNSLITNPAGGVDLMTERDGGNPVRILTGAPKYSNQFWRSMSRLSEKALRLIKMNDEKGEIADDIPEWEALNSQLRHDNIKLLSALKRMKHIEAHADSLIGSGMVDAPHTKAMRAMVQVAREAVEQVENELYVQA